MRTIRFFMCMFIGMMLVFGADSCKSKKKVHDDSDSESVSIEKEKSEKASGEKSDNSSQENAEEKDFNQERAKVENRIKANDKKMVVLDFYATWCGPCKAMAPVMNRMESKYGDKFEFKRIDVDKETELSAKYFIEAIPTIVILSPSNEVITRIEGFKDVNQMDEILSKI